MFTKRKLGPKDEYYLQHPGNQTFYKYLALVMGIIGLKTEYWNWYKTPASLAYAIQRWIIIIFAPITAISEILYVVAHYNEHSFDSLSSMLAIIPVTVTIMVKSLTAHTSKYKKSTTDFMSKIHLYNYMDKSDYSQQKRDFIAQQMFYAEKYTRWSTLYFSTSVAICSCSWNIVPLIRNIRNNDSIHNITQRLEVCIHFWQPFDYEFNFVNYVIVAIVGVYCTVCGMLVLVTFDAINLAFIYQLVGHIQIMKYDLRTGFVDKNLSDKDVKQRLVNITKYYGFITDTFKDVEGAFGLNVASIYAENLFQGGLLIYQLMTSGKSVETLLTFGLMIPIFMGMLMLISFVLENVRIQADDIPRLLYDVPWESMSISNQKIVLLTLCQVQPTLEFKAAFNIKTGVQPALAIIKTTFSYYVMLKSRI